MSYVGDYLGENESAAGGATLISMSNPSVRRLDKVRVRFTLTSGEFYLFYVSGTNYLLAYDSSRDEAPFSPLFDERSELVDEGDDEFYIDLLPNGGWWTQEFEVRVVGGGVTLGTETYFLQA